MRHSGNYGSIVSSRYLSNGVELKIYVYDELDRFVTVAGVLLSDTDLDWHKTGIAQYEKWRNDQAQPPLPWE